MGQLQLVKVSFCGSYTVCISCIDTGPTAAPPVTCSDLTNPTNGMIGYNIEAASPRPVDTVATYTCVTGYTLNGNTMRTCMSDGVWSGSAPVCQRKWNIFPFFMIIMFGFPYRKTLL